MKIFKHFIKIEQKRLYHWIIITIGLLFLGLAMCFIQIGSELYKDILHKKENFKEIERAKVKYMNYDMYGAQGFRVLFVPSPLSIFYHNSGVFSELSASLDIAERLNLTDSYLGANAFQEKQIMYADFFGLHFLFGSLITLVYAFLSFRSRAYLDILGSMGGFKKVYFHIAGARFLLLSLFFTAATALGTGLIVIHGIRLSGMEYLYIGICLVLWLFVALVMFSAGTLIGAIKGNLTGGTVLVLVWIFFFYISPLIVSQVTGAIANNMKSIYQLEKEKWDALMNFEDRAKGELGKFKVANTKTPSEREMIESFMNREYKEMMGLEKKMEKEMRDNIKVYRWLSFISPTTVLASVLREVSGKGYGNLLAFYEYVQDVKNRFCQFYKDKKFYSEDGEKVESFIKNEENIYYGNRGVSVNLPWAMVVLTLLFLVLQRFSYYVHKKAAAEVEGDAAAAWDPGLVIPARGEYGVWQIEEDAFSRGLYNYLAVGEYADDFLYLCHVEGVPGDIGAGDFLELAAVLHGVSLPGRELFWEKRWGQLKKVEKFKILMTVTELAERSGKGFYFFHDLMHEMPFEVAVMLKKRMESLSSGGGAVMFLLRDQVVSDSGLGNRYGIRKSETWSEQVEDWQKILEE